MVVYPKEPQFTSIYITIIYLKATKKPGTMLATKYINVSKITRVGFTCHWGILKMGDPEDNMEGLQNLNSM